MVTDKVAFIFPGQGAQFVGMQKDVYEKYAQAQEVFNVAEDVRV
jgi:[acyl-carrier-protein] S-malonyltransferase